VQLEKKVTEQLKRQSHINSEKYDMYQGNNKRRDAVNEEK
jgi:hypothetical protein